ncbi:hypothetical protein ACFX16_025839 [Malus domestica]
MGLLTWSASMDPKGVQSISMAERSWIFGTEFALIFEPGKITVEDASKKRSMNLRVLHGVAYGHSWFEEVMGPAAVSSFTVKSATKVTLQIKPSMKEKSARCRKFVNPATQVLEYTVILQMGSGSWNLRKRVAQSFQSATLVPGVDVYNDVLYLYEHVLLGYPYPESELVDLATQAVLDAKQFVKECSFRDDEEQLLTFFCQLLPSSTDKEIEFKRGLPPGEVVVMPQHSTIRELKQAAESALRDTYCIIERFVVMGIKGLDEMVVLFGVAKSGAEVGVRGSGIDLDTPLSCGNIHAAAELRMLTLCHRCFYALHVVFHRCLLEFNPVSGSTALKLFPFVAESQRLNKDGCG